MNLQEYIFSLTDAEFEELCTEYLQWIYQNKRINIHGTRLRKDGGKDAVGKAKDVPYEIWAECKRHNRAIGLDDISKNVVLVISKGINELLYFSTSNITRNAIKHISVVAAKHDFSVSFFYGEHLYQELARLPRFNEAPTILPVRTFDTLEIVRFFSIFEDCYEYDNKNAVVLQRDNHFYIDLFLKNMYSETITDIKCILPQVREIFFSISELNTGFSMLKNSNRIIQIQGEVLNCYSIKSIPDFIVQYKINGIQKKSSVKGGFVDPTKLIYYPLTGQTRHEFLRSSIYPLFNTLSTVKPYIISIDGPAGSGKSRLLSEIMSLARKNSFQILYCDAKKQKGYEILREYLCTCLGIPYGKGNIACTLEEFHSVILRYNGNVNISSAIYNFIYMEKTDDSIMYYLKEALIHFSKNTVGHFLLFFVIDNIQCLSGEVLDIIYFVLYRLQSTTTKTIWGLGTNTEVIPLELKDDVTAFLKKIKEYPNTVCIQYTCDELHVNDAKTLYLHAISELQNLPLLLNALIKKSGKRPFDIIMTIHWFYDKNIIRKKEHASEKEIDIDAFYQLINEIPPKSEELVMNRFKLQKAEDFPHIWLYPIMMYLRQ